MKEVHKIKTPALVVLSGGQDSTTCLFAAKQQHVDVHAITFDYGQKHSIEIEAAKKVAEMAGVISHEIIKVPNCLSSTSPLVDEDSTLEQYEDAEQMDAIIGDRRELTFVPMRNALFLTIAANRAVALNSRHIYTGVCEMDNANYDDCRSVFIEACENYINLAMGSDHRPSVGRLFIVTPLIHMSKAQSVHYAHTLDGCWEALAYTHTSYAGEYPPTDSNHANILRADGFEKAVYPDPLVLRAWKEGLMPLPLTANYDLERGQSDAYRQE